MQLLGLGRSTASVSNSVGGQVERLEIISSKPSRIALRWKATTCSVTVTRPLRDVTAERAHAAQLLVDRRCRLLLRLRVVVAAEGLDERGPALEVEGGDAVRLARMQVDRAVVHRRVGALALGDAEHRTGLLVDDRERVGRRRAQAEPRGRVVAAVPDPAGLRALELGEHRRPLQCPRAEDGRVLLVERRLEGGRTDTAVVEDAVVLVVEDRSLDAGGAAASPARA